MSIYRFHARGIGLDITPGCFICGGPQGMYNNISAFVDSYDDGEAIVKLFNQGAWLDYRPREPKWIQVKIGACDSHIPHLVYLELATDGYQHRIDERVIEHARKYGVVDLSIAPSPAPSRGRGEEE